MPKTKKENTISINQLEKYIDTFNIPIQTVSFGDLQIEVKNTIGLIPTMQLIKEVVEACFTTDDATKITAYVPYYKELILKKCLIEYYTNLKLPSDLKEIYKWFKTSDILDCLDNINPKQYSEIIVSIDEMIEFRKQEIIADKSNDVLIELTNSVDTLTNSFGFVFDNLNGVISAIGEQIKGANFSDLISKFLPMGLNEDDDKEDYRPEISN